MGNLLYLRSVDLGGEAGCAAWDIRPLPASSEYLIVTNIDPAFGDGDK